MRPMSRKGADTMLPRMAGMVVNAELCHKEIERYRVHESGGDGDEAWYEREMWEFHGLYNAGLQVARLVIRNAVSGNIIMGEPINAADSMDAAEALIALAREATLEVLHETYADVHEAARAAYAINGKKEQARKNGQ